MNDKLFFDLVRDSVFGGHISESQFEGLVKILDYRDQKWPKMIDAELADVLATAYWESGRTLQPIEEGQPTLSGDRLRKYQKSLYYWPWYGRGLVQVTHEANYKKFNIENRDDALKWDVALDVLFRGMIFGMFRADDKGPHKLSRYITEKRQDWINARLIVNGIPKGQKLPDRAVEIAGYAKAFHAALLKAATTPVVEKPAPAPIAAPQPVPAPAPAPAGPTWGDRLRDFLEKLAAQPPAGAPLPPPAPITWQVPIPAPTATPSPDIIAVANRIEERQLQMLELLKALMADMAAQKDVLELVKAHVVDLRTQLVAKDAEVAAAVGTMTPEQQAEFDAIKAQLAANTQLANEAAAA